LEDYYISSTVARRLQVAVRQTQLRKTPPLEKAQADPTENESTAFARMQQFAPAGARNSGQ